MIWLETAYSYLQIRHKRQNSTLGLPAASTVIDRLQLALHEPVICSFDLNQNWAKTLAQERPRILGGHDVFCHPHEGVEAIPVRSNDFHFEYTFQLEFDVLFCPIFFYL